MIRHPAASNGSFAKAIMMAWLLSAVAVADHPDWFQFRGPAGMGVVEQQVDLTLVGDASHVRWRTPIRGIGWSSTVTDGKRIWLTSAIATEPTESERKEALAKILMPEIKDVAGSVELLAVCLDAASGELLWEESLERIEDPNPIHPMNSYASPTPLVADDRVIFHFGGYGTWCLSGDSGKTLWRQRLAVDDSVGPGSSPIRFGDTMIVACDGIDQQFVAALSLEDGSLVWKTPRPKIRAANPEFQKAYCTPLLIEVDGQQQAIIPGAQWMVAYEPENGHEIWRFDHGSGFSTTPMPIYLEGLVLCATGYGTTELVAVDPSGRGDVTSSHERWRQRRGVPTRPSLVGEGERVYMISDNGILSACTLANGEIEWKTRVGGLFSASPIRSGNQILIASHEGEVTVFRPGPSYEKISSRNMNEQIMASPIVIDGDIVLRTREAVYRYQVQDQ